jgi:uncharacterized repeat protein (TIGR03803 family)
MVRCILMSGGKMRSLFAPIGGVAVAAVVTAISSSSVQADARPKAVITILHSFGTDGQHPFSGLVADKSGTMYGTTLHGGATSLGTVYKLAPDGAVSVIYNFQGTTDGAFPFSGVTLDKKGNLYGVTSGADVSDDYGTVYKMTAKGKEKVLHVLNNVPDGNSPQSELVDDGEGNFYGTAAAGGMGAGDVFRISPSGNFEVVYSFIGGADGGNPVSGLITDGSGNFFGTTYNGGDHGWGTVFGVTAGGGHTILYSFTGGTDGRNPWSGLVADKSGNFYGTTYFGGDQDMGVVFKLAPDGTQSVLHSFTGGNDGSNPIGNLLIDKKGNLYGTANLGGKGGAGTVFEISAHGKFSTLYAFKGAPKDGANPAGDLYMDGDGVLFGTTENGGENASGTIFKLTIQ